MLQSGTGFWQPAFTVKIPSRKTGAVQPVKICLDYSARILKDHYVWPDSLREMKTTL